MKSTRLPVAALMLSGFFLIIALGCGEEECALCPEVPTCPACTLAVPFAIEPVFDACVKDGGTYTKDGLGDWALSNSKLIIGNNMSPIRDYNYETRGIMEFDITSITGTLEEAHLELVLDGFENQPHGVSLVLCNYIGNASFKIFDFNLGQPVDTVTFNYEWEVSFDITETLRAHIAAGDTCAGFNLRVSPPTNVASAVPSVIFRST